MVTASERARRGHDLVRLRRDLRRASEARLAPLLAEEAGLVQERTQVVTRLQEISGPAATSYLQRLRVLESKILAVKARVLAAELEVRAAARNVETAARWQGELQKSADREIERQDLADIIESATSRLSSVSVKGASSR